MLGDITCDSDGKIEQFIDRRDVKKTLPLHPFNGEPYYLGAFLLGAYQEILGDMHNLFGDTNAVHVSMGDDGEVVLETVIKGDTVREVLDYVEFNVERLVRQFRSSSRGGRARSRDRLTKKPAASSASTRKACKATRIWKTPANSGKQAAGFRSHCVLPRPNRPLRTAYSFTPMPVRGVIFDLDGTLVDSGLDFDLMRREMGLPPGRPLLEAIDELEEPAATRCREILARHEWTGASTATLMPGVQEFLVTLHHLGIPRAIFTCNSRAVALATLKRLALDIETLVTREDAPAKPDPTAIWRICAMAIAASRGRGDR